VDSVPSLIAKWLFSLAAAFILFPFGYVLWHGNYADEFFGCVIMMLFAQFISPFHFWFVPAALGTLAALLWHGISDSRRRRREDNLSA
jgi:hypothetical protein